MTLVLIAPLILFIIGLYIVMGTEAKHARRHEKGIPRFTNGDGRNPLDQATGQTYFVASPLRQARPRRTAVS